MMFFRSFIFFLGVLATLLLGWAGLVGIPNMMISEGTAAEGIGTLHV